MRRSSRVLVVVALGCILASALGGVSSAAPAKKKCAKGKIALVANGKRTCVSAARFRQSATPPPSAATSLLQDALADGPLPLRLKNGKRARPPLPKSVVSAATRTYTVGEAQLRASVESVLGQAAKARSHEIGFTGGSVTKSADGTSATGTLGFGGDAGKGYTVSGKVEIGTNVSGKMDIGLDITVTDPTGGSKTTGLAARDIISRDQECPGADGNLPVKSGSDITVRTAETLGSKRVHLGSAREAITSATKASAQVAFGPDGKAQPFVFVVSTTYDRATSAEQGLLSKRVRTVTSGTMTGTIDPATGKVSDATVTRKGRASALGLAEASTDAEMRALTEELLNDEVGRLLEKVRDAERSCGGFEVVLSVRTTADFATHTASGSIFAVIVASKAGPNEFKGSVAAPYEDVSYTSKIGCSYISPVNNTITLEATITVNPDGSLKVKWTTSSGLNSTASVLCPGGPPPPPPIPGQSGPQLVQPMPAEFALPPTGGTQAVSGGFQDGGDGWTHTGTIRVKRYGS